MTQSNDQGDTGNLVAVDQVMQRFMREADEDEEQYGLFAEPHTEAGRAKAIGYRRGPGRPPGSRNKRTERTIAFLLARHRDPREILLEMAAANVADLAGLLECTLLEAAQEKRLAAIAVMPFLHARLTPDVIDNRQIVHLHFGALDAGSTGGGGTTLSVRVIDPIDIEGVEIDAGS